ncbi:MGMT family protein [Algoriphagus sp. C2-6-M1]|uniref:MGMT family protein n=1 Tax=Algoriphagus persicinus TaxID=3108754 RepID=UPI002B39447B|nr:MGMT family protein [Algoriphagus sp. C2-6-M1]MEB2781910.1 MGMT family protein [Algoriphagus sp. C2-6-M1]
MKPEKPNYFDLVYQVVRLIPNGRVTNYGAIAHYLGIKSGARMVGYAMNAAHTMADVPAHRVVNSQGLLTGKGHFSTATEMQELLEKEGVKIVKDKVQNFEKVFWNPEVELAL